jgi:hypothetical protein
MFHSRAILHDVLISFADISALKIRGNLDAARADAGVGRRRKIRSRICARGRVLCFKVNMVSATSGLATLL